MQRVGSEKLLQRVVANETYKLVPRMVSAHSLDAVRHTARNAERKQRC